METRPFKLTFWIIQYKMSTNPLIMFSLLVYIEWFRGTSPNHGLRPLKAHNQTVTQAGNVTISWLHYLPKPSHHHQTLICRGSNDELMSANSQTVEDYHRLEIFCEYFHESPNKILSNYNGFRFLLFMKLY